MKYKIKIKKFVPDLYDGWECNYQRLLEHHEEETKLLVAEIERLEALQESTWRTNCAYFVGVVSGMCETCGKYLRDHAPPRTDPARPSEG